MTKEELQFALDAEAKNMAQARRRVETIRQELYSAESEVCASGRRMRSLFDSIIEIEREENRRAADPDLVKRTEEWGNRIDALTIPWNPENARKLTDVVLGFVLFMQQNGMKLRFVDDNFYHEDYDGYEYGGWKDGDLPKIYAKEVTPSVYRSSAACVMVEVESGKSWFDIAIPFSDYKRRGFRKDGLGRMIVFPPAK